VVANENRIGVAVVAGVSASTGFEARGNSEAGIQAYRVRVRLTSLVARGNGLLGGVLRHDTAWGKGEDSRSTILDNNGLSVGTTSSRPAG
jgi:hypothetical protein